MSSTFMIETPFMSSALKSSKSSVCVAGGARSNTKVKVFYLAPPATQNEILDDFNAEDMKSGSIMKVEDMVKIAVKGMQNRRFEIRPGQANQLKMMSRLAPGFILKQMSRSVDRMLRTQD